MPPAAPPPEKKRVSLKEMLRWAYNRQQVDILTGKTLDPEEAVIIERGSDSCERVARSGVLGIVADGGRNRFIRNEVHPDAEALHDKVIELKPIDARLVVQFGHTGWFPEPMVSEPRPVPMSGHGRGAWEDEKRGRWRGEPMRYCIRRVVEKERVAAYDLKGRFLRWDERPLFLEYCPIEYWPDPSFVTAANGMADYWERVMAVLRARVADVIFVAHEIDDALQDS